MKRYVIFLFSIFLFLSSCSLFGNHTVYRDIYVTNNDTVTRIVVLTPTKDNKRGDILSLSVTPGETVKESITGPYRVTSKNINRYTIKEIGYDKYVIYPVLPEVHMYSILNTLPLTVTLKDRTYSEWSVSIETNNTKTKEASLYSDEVHDWYIQGSLSENGFNYVMNGTDKLFYKITVTENTIVISSL